MTVRRRRSEPGDEAAIAKVAALWIARRDRGLTAAEQDEYMQWLTANPRHAEVFAQHAAAFARMMQLYEWQPGQSETADPDLFAPRRTRRRLTWGLALAAAAAISISAALWWDAIPPPEPAIAPGKFLRVNERQMLPDGSVVDLKDGSRISVDFTDGARSVRLTGEAHFNVAKSAVPFLVQAGNVTVQAVGTAFNVRADADVVDVLVLEGRVAVQAAAAAVPVSSGLESAIGQTDVVFEIPAQQYSTQTLSAGQRAILPVDQPAALRVTEVSGIEMEAALEWKLPHLQFFETPLAVAVAEFNRLNRIRLVIQGRGLGAVPIGGTFRADNVEGFIRLLEITLDIRAERRGDREVVLTWDRQ